ncbi:hypothetical protein OG693_39745 (plasmid) [Streptomyces sp. NBC_01259]|uniref:hypothetical protein n=1 Tax=Streptomyces sp. NBC_01259 TaxID=2903800 RepID=UPI002F90886C
MTDFSAAEHRLVVLKPGDILVISRTANLSSAAAQGLKNSLGLAAIVALPEDIDITAVSR